jgi:hypothetical protein
VLLTIHRAAQFVGNRPEENLSQRGWRLAFLRRLAKGAYKRDDIECHGNCAWFMNARTVMIAKAIKSANLIIVAVSCCP